MGRVRGWEEEEQHCRREEHLEELRMEGGGTPDIPRKRCRSGARRGAMSHCPLHGG